jgi:hypothetical protein
LGLPLSWDRVSAWISFSGVIPQFQDSSMQIFKKKCPEIPVRKNYSKKPDANFWKAFPSCSLPEKAFSRIFFGSLKGEILAAREKIKYCEFRRGMRCVKNLEEGAEAFQKSELPPCVVDNAPSAVKHGEAVTDAVASWVKAGFAAGPFNFPPPANFRVNSLMAIPQGVKVRPVLNVSLPEGRSLNSNVREACLEKVTMCSARCFAYSVKECGKFAWMTKPDWCDAYKNIPCKIADLRLQGFCWQSKFFIETRQIFGAKASVANFDTLGNTILSLVLSDCSIPASLIHRQLDNIPGVAPYSKKFWCEEFITKYKKLCELVNIELAKDCPECDKAFSLTHVGKVLGIIFDTGKLCWR